MIHFAFHYKLGGIIVVEDAHTLEFVKLTIEYGRNLKEFCLFLMVNFNVLNDYVG